MFDSKGATKISLPSLMENIGNWTGKGSTKWASSFFPLLRRKTKMGQIKHQKLSLQFKHLSIQKSGVISLLWNWWSPEEVLFVLGVNTSLISTISHASLFWLVLFTNVLSLKMNISQSFAWTGTWIRHYKLDDIQKLLNKTKIISSKPMRLATVADSVMMFCIIASMAIFDAFATLLSILKKRIFVDQKSLLIQKTNSELRTMLVGIKKISKLNKRQLVNLVL